MNKDRKVFLAINEECIFENVFLVVVKMKSDSVKVVNTYM